MSSKLKYLSQFPIFLYQYIDDIVDVRGDGNYGFRAITVLLGWEKKYWHWIHTQLDTEVYQHRQLYSNLFYDTVPKVRSALWVDGFGVQGREKWTTISDMGYPIAYRTIVIFVSLSSNIDITFIPLLVSPSMSVSRQK